MLLASGLAHQREGRLAQAEHCYLAALRIDPGNAEATYRMGVLGLQSGNGEGALAYLSRVIAARLNDADALYNMAMANVLADRLGEGQRWFRRCLDVDPGHVLAHVGLGNALRFLGRVEEAAEHYRMGVRLPGVTASIFSNLLVALHSNPQASLDELFELHREWERRFALPIYRDQRPHASDRTAERVLRVGFVSPSFNSNIVGHFFRGVLAALARRDDVEPFLYANSTNTDWISAELKKLGAQWRDVETLSDDAAAAQVRVDKIDILVDLAGHTPGNRLLMFALRPAPIQITWLDYFDTTGMTAIDYLVADPTSAPADGAQRFTERVLRMPSARLCFTAPPFAPAVAPLPVLRAGSISFGSFTRSDKISPEVVAVWARVLADVPHSRLVLKSGTLKFSEVRSRLQRNFGELGIDSARLEFRNESAHPQLLAEYADVDIALDPFPYNGGATTCDALWMGVPVVARLGNSMVSRQSAAMLQAAGLPQLVARDDQHYVQIAVALAADHTALAALRGRLRSQTAASPLCDANGFAEALMQQLRRIWHEWCRT